MRLALPFSASLGLPATTTDRFSPLTCAVDISLTTCRSPVRPSTRPSLPLRNEVNSISRSNLEGPRIRSAQQRGGFNDGTDLFTLQTQLPADYIELEKRVDALKQVHQKLLAVT